MAASGEQAVALFRQHRPHVTLMDLQLPGLSGLDAITAKLPTLSAAISVDVADGDAVDPAFARSLEGSRRPRRAGLQRRHLDPP